MNLSQKDKRKELKETLSKMIYKYLKDAMKTTIKNENMIEIPVTLIEKVLDIVLVSHPAQKTKESRDLLVNELTTDIMEIGMKRLLINKDQTDFTEMMSKLQGFPFRQILKKSMLLAENIRSSKRSEAITSLKDILESLPKNLINQSYHEILLSLLDLTRSFLCNESV